MTIAEIKTNLRCTCLVLIAIFVVCTSATAQTKDDRTLSPYFVVKGDPSVDQLPLKDTNVEIAVSGVIADVKVVQTRLRHATASTTLDTYGHLWPDSDDTTRTAVAAAISRPFQAAIEQHS